MENQPCFDLNDALVRWRRDLASQPGLDAEDIRELETHLLEGVSAFRRRGFSEGEAFAEAREKLGPAALVGAEFAKAHLLRIWRDRVFWIALIGCVGELFYSAGWPLLKDLADWLRASQGTLWAVVTISALGSFPCLVISFLMGSGYAEVVYRKLSWLFARRWRLAAAGVMATIAANWFTYRTMGVLIVFELGFLGFAILVMPPELRVASACKSHRLANWRNCLGVWRDRLFWVALAGLAISAWTTAISFGADAYFLRLLESQPATIPVIASVLFFLIWLGPMGLVGLGLWTGHLSVISRALRSRRQVALIGGALVLTMVAGRLWLSTWNVASARVPVADWKFRYALDAGCGLFAGILLVAMMIWVLPWQRKRRLAC